ncbi:MAG: hypothetical protein J0M04_09900 [Verrucomicrobia bacterium]|nr:hypothetical protein [Verrucomicrobiota bacterium]
MTPTVTSEDDNHGKFVMWKCELTGVDPLDAAQSGSLSSAVQAAVNEHNNQWKISPGGTVALPALAFPALAKLRAQEGFAEWARNPAPGAVCNIN